MHRGGGNSLKLSHNQDFSLIEAFNNLAPWGEKKFISELKRTYKFQRGVYCHTEDNSPKYRMVGNDVGLESPTYRNNCGEYRKTVITRSEKRRSNLIQNENNAIGATHVAHWNNSRKIAFTLAEVLITLGIIGVVVALTLPSLVQNYRKSVVENKLKASYSIISNAVKMAEVENGMGFDFTISDEYKDENDVNNFSAKQSEAIFNTYFKSYFKVVKEYSKKDNNKFDYYGQKGGKIDDVAKTGKCFELTNGTAMCFVARGGTVGNFYVYLNPEKEKKVAGSDVFAFRLDKSRGAYWSYGLTNVSTGFSRQQLLDGCSNVYDHALVANWNRPDICTYLIQLNGWKIPNDYPVRL